MAMSSSSPRPCSDDWKACAVPWNDVETLAGSVFAASSLICVDRIAERDARLEIERDRDRGKLAGVIDASAGRRRCAASPRVSSGTSLPDGGAHVEQRQRRGFAWYAGSSSMMTWYALFGA